MEEGEEEETGVAAAGIKPDPVCIVYKVSLYLSPGGIGSFYTGNHHALFGRSTSPPVIIMATRRDFMVLPRLVTLNYTTTRYQPVEVANRNGDHQ